MCWRISRKPSSKVVSHTVANIAAIQLGPASIHHQKEPDFVDNPSLVDRQKEERNLVIIMITTIESKIEDITPWEVTTTYSRTFDDDFSILTRKSMAVRRLV